jgi:hypothetical protein
VRIYPAYAVVEPVLLPTAHAGQLHRDVLTDNRRVYAVQLCYRADTVERLHNRPGGRAPRVTRLGRASDCANITGVLYSHHARSDICLH